MWVDCSHKIITGQWKLHRPESQYLLSMQDVKFIISVVRGCVVQGMFSVPIFIGKF